MLELLPYCECCGKDLPPESAEAMICSFECTFCKRCNEELLKDMCPNCGGKLVERPIRPEKHLVKNPPSTRRIVKEDGCVANA